MSDTPKTREAARMGFIEGNESCPVFVVPLKVAEELERELAQRTAERDALAAEVAALKADLIAEQGYRDLAEELRGRRGATINALIADIADLRTRLDTAWGDVSTMQGIVARVTAERDALAAQADPLAEMWRELAEYQPIADSDGHGDTWRAMCADRTGAAAWAAARAAYPSSAASAAARAASARRASVALANAGQAEAESASAAIRKAKEVAE